MTTIAFHNGKMYSDTQSRDANTDEIGRSDKSITLHNCLVAGSGYQSGIYSFVVSMLNNPQRNIVYVDRDCTVMLVNQDALEIWDSTKLNWFKALIHGNAYKMERTSLYETTVFEDCAIAIGSGAQDFITNWNEHSDIKKALIAAAENDKATNRIFTVKNIDNSMTEMIVV